MHPHTVAWIPAVVGLSVSLAAQSPLTMHIDAVDLGDGAPQATVSFTNRSSALVAVARPVDASTYGSVLPHYAFTVERLGKAAATPGRCGNNGGHYREVDVIDLAPGRSAVVTVTVPVLLTPGKWRFRLTYTIEPTDPPVGGKGDHLWFGSVQSEPFEVGVPGPVWDEWIEGPTPELEQHLLRGLGDADAAVVGEAVDALVQLEAAGTAAAITTPVRANMTRAFTTLMAGVRAEQVQRFDRTRVLGQQLAALLVSPSLPDPDRHRDLLRRAFRDTKPGTARQTFAVLLAANPVAADLGTFETELARPSGDGETFRVCLAAFATLRSTDLAIAQAMALLERTPPGEQFFRYAFGLSQLIGDDEPCYVRIGENGRMFPSEPEQHRLVKQQWLAWWKGRGAK